MSIHSFSHYETAQSVTTSDTAPISAKAFLASGAGNVAFVPSQGGNTITITIVVGQVYPIGVSRILATGTTATNIVALA